MGFTVSLPQPLSATAASSPVPLLQHWPFTSCILKGQPAPNGSLQSWGDPCSRPAAPPALLLLLHPPSGSFCCCSLLVFLLLCSTGLARRVWSLVETHVNETHLSHSGSPRTVVSPCLGTRICCLCQVHRWKLTATVENQVNWGSYKSLASLIFPCSWAALSCSEQAFWDNLCSFCTVVSTMRSQAFYRVLIKSITRGQRKWNDHVLGHEIDDSHSWKRFNWAKQVHKCTWLTTEIV